MGKRKARAVDPRLGALEAVAKALADAPPPPPPPPRAPPPLRLTEAQLMQAAFDALGSETGLDWTRIEIVGAQDPTQAELSAADPSGNRAEPLPVTPPRQPPAIPTAVGQATSWRDQGPDRIDLEALIARAGRQRLPQLSLRRLSLPEALAQSQDFVEMLSAVRIEFARIITGKGISSPAGAVIRPAIVEACRADGRVHRVLEEADHLGEVGTLIVQIRLDPSTP